jgi:hypothetical protein
LNVAACGCLDLPKVACHWPDTIRVFSSIYTGAVRAYDRKTSSERSDS